MGSPSAGWRAKLRQFENASACAGDLFPRCFTGYEHVTRYRLEHKYGFDSSLRRRACCDFSFRAIPQHSL